mmetsp:Transcript_31462/g.80200  ORF Transcript_31462/g.80200 Transcript_31462/m.80200 type:complete len:80 (+) Transcript_31462:680-919(+)
MHGESPSTEAPCAGRTQNQAAVAILGQAEPHDLEPKRSGVSESANVDESWHETDASLWKMAQCSPLGKRLKRRSLAAPT